MRTEGASGGGERGTGGAESVGGVGENGRRDDDLETTGGGDSSTNSGLDSEEGSVEVIHDKMP